MKKSHKKKVTSVKRKPALKKAPKKSGTKPKAKQPKTIELHSWVRPFNTEAVYWTHLIGEVVRFKTAHSGMIAVVSFKYRVDGSKTERDETMEFPVAKLRLCVDFSARIKKANPPPIPMAADDYEVVEETVEEPAPKPTKTLKLSGNMLVIDVPNAGQPGADDEQSPLQEAAALEREIDEADAETPPGAPPTVTQESATSDFAADRLTKIKNRFKSLSELPTSHIS